MKSFLPFLSVDRKREIVGILTITLGVLILVSLATHRAADDLWFTDEEIPQSIAPEAVLSNQGGVVGAAVAFVLLNLLGFCSLFVPLWSCGKGWSLVSHQPLKTYLRNIWLLFLGMFALGVLFSVPAAGRHEPLMDPTSTLGGFLARWTSAGLVSLFGTLGGIVVTLGLIFVLLAMLVSWRPKDMSLGRLSGVLRKALAWIGRISNPVQTRGSSSRRPRTDRDSLVVRLRALWHRLQEFAGFGAYAEAEVDVEPAAAQRLSLRRGHVVEASSPPDFNPEMEIEGEPDVDLPAIRPRTRKRATPAPMATATAHDFEFPPFDLLLKPQPNSGAFASRTEIEATSNALRQTLETFGVGIDGPIRQYPGPVITRYEFKPAVGVKVNQVLSLADDLALALSAKRIRIIAPIPGKPAVGVEIPNREPQTVYLSEIIGSPEFAKPEWRLPLALGKTTAGQPFIADLARMPHLLIAGATGSGKSVCINAIITSLLYRLPPERVRFLFIDPKMLELSVYDGIPHLERPVVTKSKQAEKILLGAVSEMEDRYGRLAKAGVRNIEDYNAKFPDEPLPYVIIIVDELADLMMSSESNRIETTTARLAQMARAVGIHLILATQRPSVDVITGVIKANFSSRIAFQVASKVDSRTILDSNGAERLLGRGDMLFILTGEPEPIRIHGAFVTGAETESIVGHLREVQVEPEPIEMFSTDEEDDYPEGDSRLDEYSDDPLFREAAEVVIKAKMGSVSLLQRRLGIGYQRAGRLIDQLEKAGIVGPHDGSRAREVLVDLSYLEAGV